MAKLNAMDLIHVSSKQLHKGSKQLRNLKADYND